MSTDVQDDYGCLPKLKITLNAAGCLSMPPMTLDAAGCLGCLPMLKLTLSASKFLNVHYNIGKIKIFSRKKADKFFPQTFRVKLLSVNVIVTYQ